MASVRPSVRSLAGEDNESCPLTTTTLDDSAPLRPRGCSSLRLITRIRRRRLLRFRCCCRGGDGLRGERLKIVTLTSVSS